MEPGAALGVRHGSCTHPNVSCGAQTAPVSSQFAAGGRKHASFGWCLGRWAARKRWTASFGNEKMKHLEKNKSKWNISAFSCFFSLAYPISNSSQIFEDLRPLPNCLFFCEMIFENRFSPALWLSNIFFPFWPSYFPPCEAELLPAEVARLQRSSVRGLVNIWIPSCFFPLSCVSAPAGLLESWIFLKIYSPAKMLKSFNFSVKMWDLCKTHVSRVGYRNMAISCCGSLHWLNKLSDLISITDGRAVGETCFALCFLPFARAAAGRGRPTTLGLPPLFHVSQNNIW